MSISQAHLGMRLHWTKRTAAGRTVQFLLAPLVNAVSVEQVTARGTSGVGLGYPQQADHALILLQLFHR